LGKYIRNTLEVLKCDAGKGWRPSVEKVLHSAKKERNTLQTII
jgi:hypothetical protein